MCVCVGKEMAAILNHNFVDFFFWLPFFLGTTTDLFCFPYFGNLALFVCVQPQNNNNSSLPLLASEANVKVSECDWYE